MPMITTLSEHTRIYSTLSRAKLICELSTEMIGYYSAIVWLCVVHLMYEIVYHYSPVFVTMYTYVH